MIWQIHQISCYTVLSVSKCKVLLLHIGSTLYTGNYALDGIKLELLDNFCDLGIQIDSKLKFHNNTDTVVKKVYQVLGLIRMLLECKDSNVMVKLYKILVCLIIE